MLGMHLLCAIFALKAFSLRVTLKMRSLHSSQRHQRRFNFMHFDLRKRVENVQHYYNNNNNNSKLGFELIQ